ncbi:hypothetical protein DN745_10475 [Bradymonas sediminis]|uniref:Glycosyltransferase RgtA/B/C/D-like domain-containing protein n=1 Tax=Bradymonas sediminis TaxID=1548548 RepID=A0A2Z4FL62_9DELT|nr:hypothetical protein DN745_10475 [Bradymonas sediminis]
MLPFSLVLLCFGMLPLRSWDYWWHLTMGRLVHQYGAIPAANHYLYTMDPEAPSYIQPWLSQWLFYWLHDLGGLQLVLLVRNLIAGGLAAFLGMRAMRQSRSAMFGAVLTLVGFAQAFPYIAARSHLFVLPLFALLVWLGARIRKGQTPLAAVILFPGVAALWANLHGSFFLPAAIALAFGAASICDRFDPRPLAERRTVVEAPTKQSIAWFGAFVVSLVAPLLNPRGAEIYGYVIALSTNPEIQNTVTEWMAATPWNPPGIGMIFYASMGAGAYIFWRNRRSVDPADVFLFAGLALMTIMAARAMLWFALIIPFVLAAYLRADDATRADKAPDIPPRPVRAFNLLFAIALLMSALILQPGTIYHRDFVNAYPAIPTRDAAPLNGLVLARTPVMETAILEQHPGDQHIFHDQEFAGYLLFHLTRSRPAPIVFVDQRVELPSAEIWDLYAVASTTSAWKGIFQQYDITAALLNKETQPILIENMRADSDWEIRHESAYNVLFIEKKRR